MKPLNLKHALELGSILYDYIPDEFDGDGLEFVGTIIDNIKTSGNYKDYLRATSMFCDYPVEALIEMDNTQFVVETFTEGALSNNLLELKQVMKLMRFGNGRSS